MRAGRLLFPALRWSPQTGFAHEAATIETALAMGVGGFCLFGGTAAAVRPLTAGLRRRSAQPLLIASDLERGAGQQFTGATQLPPLAAIGALDDVSTTRRSAGLTAREARALGVNWVYAPVADVDLEPRNPIIGTRAFGSDPARVAAHVAAWIQGCHDAGVLCCAKHFPGHGRTIEDSHAGLPRVGAARADLEADLTPFRAAVRAGVDAIMTAHVSFPALDPAGAPATRSAPILQELLRGELGFRGLAVTDALIMEGAVHGAAGEEGAVVAAVAAGCDALLYPRDLEAAAHAVEQAIGGAIAASRIEEAVARIDDAARRAAPPSDEPVGRAADAAWALELAARCCTVVRGEPHAARDTDVLTVDDDLGGPYPPPARDTFLGALAARGPAAGVEQPDGSRPLIIAVYADIRAWKGRPGLSDDAQARVRTALARRADATIVLFGHPRLAEGLDGSNLLCAWGGEAIMQNAAAQRLCDGGPGA